MSMDRIDEIGYIAWEEYYRQLERHISVRPKRGGHTYWDDKKYKIFRKIAEICIDNDIDPAEYFLANFSRLDKDYNYIRPDDFITPAAMARYKQQGISDPGRSWVVQVGMLTDIEYRCVPKYFKDELEILGDHNTPFRPWFRVIYPVPFNEGIFNRFGSLAWSQLREDRRLRVITRRHSLANMEQLELRLGRFGDIEEGVRT